MLPKEVKDLEKKIKSVVKRYYYLTFDSAGYKNWNHYLKYCLPDVRKKRILNVKCDTGIYDLEMAKMGAGEVIGIDSDISQALSSRDILAKKDGISFANVRFVERDICKRGLGDFGKFDFAYLLDAVCNYREKTHFIMDEVSKITDTMVLQGSLKHLIPHNYRGKIEMEYAGIDGMRNLLWRHGFKKICVFDIANYPKPVVIGEKQCAG